MSEVLKRIFAKDIQKNLFPNNEFYQGSKVDKGVAIDATSVDIPQAGQKPESGKNPTEFPLGVTTREDDKKSYDVDLYYTKPIHVTDVNQLIVSYDKRKEILEDKVNVLNTDYADDLAQIWCPTLATHIIRTSGSAKPATIDGATGNRASMALADFIEVDRLMNRMEVPKKGRRVLLSADMYAELLTAGIQGFVGAEKLSEDLLKQGVLGRLLGFDIYVRSSVARYSNDPTPQKRAVGALAQASDNDVALFYHPFFVRRAEGKLKVYAEYDKPTWLGSVFNVSFRGGGVLPRKDEVGVVALVQKHA